jgi:hypothetical protein
MAARPRAEDPRPGDPDRTPELAHRSGWAWTPVVRRYDEYERLMGRLEAARSEAPKASSPAPGR